MNYFRTRFKKEIVAEFYLPRGRSATLRGLPRKSRSGSRGKPRKNSGSRGKPAEDKVIIFFAGMPSVPRQRSLLEFLAQKGYWVFYPRYRGSWESGGSFLEKSPHLDALDVVSGLQKGEIKELAFGQKFKINPRQIFVIGGSFGGPVALLASLDPRVKKVVANCPVVDWKVQKRTEKAETSNKNYAAFVHEAFGEAYRLKERNWRKLYTGKFFNPMSRVGEMDGGKIMMFHAKDDPVVPWRTVQKFAKLSGADLKLLSRGGHLPTDYVVRKYWPQISKFFRSK